MSWSEYRDSGVWLWEAVPYFRALGFYPNEQHLSDGELIEHIRAYHSEDWDDLLLDAKDMAAADLWLLTPDTSQTWFHDLEGVYRGESMYTRSLEEWAVLSRGAFTPTEVAETWASEHGPVNVTFSFRGETHTFVHPDGDDDFIDLRIVRWINQLIQPSQYRLEACDSLGDCRFIVALTPEEKEQLKRERGWAFCDFLSAI